jgi:hypothetical protein
MKNSSSFGSNSTEPFRTHLIAFARNFISANFQGRWIHVLCERPEKARDEMHKFERHRLPVRCRLLANNERDASLTDLVGDESGVFFDGKAAARLLSLTDALELMQPYPDDALISFKPGKLAVFFHHDGGVWLCQ